MNEQSQERLIELLRARNLPIDHEAISAAFSDPQSQLEVQNWMRECLGPETLLTLDEVALYEALKRNGQFETLAASQDLSKVECLTDQEIRDAIEELKRSTASIEKQTETLRLQQEAMRKLVKGHARNTKSRSQVVESQARKWESEKAQVDAEIREISGGLKVRIGELGQESRAREVTLKQNVEGILKSDDKLLASLQKLAGEMDSQQPEDDKTVARVRELCARLIKHTVEGVRTRLDRIYFESLRSSEPTASSDHKDNQEITELKEELESLYSEILPVAQMSAGQQFLTPALHAIASKSSQGGIRSAKALEYIHQCLDFLTTRLDTFAERVDEHQCHQTALRAIIDTAENELRLPRPKSPVKSSSPTRPAGRKASTTEGRTGSITKASIKGRNTKRRSSLQTDEDIDPEQQTLRNLGITLLPHATAPKDRLQALETALSDRMHKLEAHAASLQSTTETSISAHLHDARITFQILQDALLSETSWHTPKLLDEDIEEAVKMFEDEIGDLDRGVERVDLGSLQGRNVHRERIVERWSR